MELLSAKPDGNLVKDPDPAPRVPHEEPATELLSANPGVILRKEPDPPAVVPKVPQDESREGEVRVEARALGMASSMLPKETSSSSRHPLE